MPLQILRLNASLCPQVMQSWRPCQSRRKSPGPSTSVAKFGCDWAAWSRQLPPAYLPRGSPSTLASWPRPGASLRPCSSVPRTTPCGRLTPNTKSTSDRLCCPNCLSELSGFLWWESKLCRLPSGTSKIEVVVVLHSLLVLLSDPGLRTFFFSPQYI